MRANKQRQAVRSTIPALATRDVTTRSVLASENAEDLRQSADLRARLVERMIRD
jgi:hypothetical protein